MRHSPVSTRYVCVCASPALLYSTVMDLAPVVSGCVRPCVQLAPQSICVWAINREVSPVAIGQAERVRADVDKAVQSLPFASKSYAVL